MARTPVIDYAGVVPIPVYTAPPSGTAEPPLGNPAGEGYVLSTRASGTRQWASTSEINAKARGIKADGATDDYAALQALITETEGNVSSGITTVRLPDGAIILSHPLEMKASRIRLIGDQSMNPSGTKLYPNGSFGGGPLIFVGGARPATATGAALATGGGVSLSATTAYFQIPLSVIPSMYLNALTEFTAECWIKPIGDCAGGALATYTEMIICSSGQRTINEGQVVAFFLARVNVSAVNDNFPQLAWRKQDGTYTFITGTTKLNGGVIYHIRMVVHSGTVTLYVNGVSQGSFSEGGLKINQQRYENVTLGIDNYGVGPYNTGAYSPVLGLYDGIRFSNSARCTSNFTPPTAKVSSDANTILLLNNDANETTFIVGYTGAAAAKCFIVSSTTGTQIANNAVENMALIGGGGLWVMDSFASYFKNITTYQCWQGMTMRDVYQSRIQDINMLSSGQRYGICLMGSSEMTIDRFNTAGGFYPLWSAGSSGVYSNLSVTPYPETDACYTFTQGDTTINDYTLDDEGTWGSVVGKYGMIISNIGPFNCIGGQMLFGSGLYTPFWIEGTYPTNIIGTSLSNTGATSADQVFKVTGATPPQINVIGCGATGPNSLLTASTAPITTIGCTGIANSLPQSRTVTAKTASYTLTSANNNSTFTNLGAGGTVIFTLPAATVGLTYGASVEVAQILRLLAVTPDTIRNAATVGAAAGNIQAATIGNQITISCTQVGKWVVTSIIGTWTLV